MTVTNTIPNDDATERTGLVRYDLMTRAIAECRKVDELKDYRDKARALELYAKQARNRDAEAQAAEVRIRAERQCSILIREGQADGTIATQSRHPGSVASVDTAPKVLADLNVSRDQSSRWGKLADIPDDEFEARLAETRDRGDVPTTEGIALQKSRAPESEDEIIASQQREEHRRRQAADEEDRRIAIHGLESAINYFIAGACYFPKRSPIEQARALGVEVADLIGKHFKIPGVSAPAFAAGYRNAAELLAVLAKTVADAQLAAAQPLHVATAAEYAAASRGE